MHIGRGAPHYFFCFNLSLCLPVPVVGAFVSSYMYLITTQQKKTVLSSILMKKLNRTDIFICTTTKKKKQNGHETTMKESTKSGYICMLYVCLCVSVYLCKVNLPAPTLGRQENDLIWEQVAGKKYARRQSRHNIVSEWKTCNIWENKFKSNKICILVYMHTWSR